MELIPRSRAGSDPREEHLERLLRDHHPSPQPKMRRLAARHSSAHAPARSPNLRPASATVHTGPASLPILSAPSITTSSLRLSPPRRAPRNANQRSSIDESVPPGLGESRPTHERDKRHSPEAKIQGTHPLQGPSHPAETVGRQHSTPTRAGRHRPRSRATESRDPCAPRRSRAGRLSRLTLPRTLKTGAFCSDHDRRAPRIGRSRTLPKSGGVAAAHALDRRRSEEVGWQGLDLGEVVAVRRASMDVAVADVCLSVVSRGYSPRCTRWLLRAAGRFLASKYCRVVVGSPACRVGWVVVTNTTASRPLTVVMLTRCRTAWNDAVFIRQIPVRDEHGAGRAVAQLAPAPLVDRIGSDCRVPLAVHDQLGDTGGTGLLAGEIAGVLDRPRTRRDLVFP